MIPYDATQHWDPRGVGDPANICRVGSLPKFCIPLPFFCGCDVVRLGVNAMTRERSRRANRPQVRDVQGDSFLGFRPEFQLAAGAHR